jgi:surface antigen
MTKANDGRLRWAVPLVLAAVVGLGAAAFFQARWSPSLEPTPPASTLGEKPQLETQRDPAPPASVAATPPAVELAAKAPEPTSAAIAAKAPEPTSAATPEVTGSLPPVSIPVGAVSFSATRNAHEIELTGRMPEPVREAILSELRALTPGVTLVDRTESGGPGTLKPESQRAVKFAMAQLADLNTGVVQMQDGSFSLKGETKDRQALLTVTAALQQPPAGLKVESPALKAASISPFTFTARREAGALVLRGYVPSRDVRQEIADAVRERFFHERVVDEARIADGAPPRFAAGVRFALDQLSQLASGEATVTGSALRISGEALYPEAAERMRKTVVQAPPPGWKGTAEIKVRESD